jgi:hypothetical protein
VTDGRVHLYLQRTKDAVIAVIGVGRRISDSPDGEHYITESVYGSAAREELGIRLGSCAKLEYGNEKFVSPVFVARHVVEVNISINHVGG